MATIHKLNIRAKPVYTETNIELLHQTNIVYPQLDQALPEGKFKDEILAFVAQKKAEYIKQIMSL